MKLIVLHEKHGDRYLTYSTKNLRNIIGERFYEDGYYYGQDAKRALELLNATIIGDAPLLKFLNERKDHEYEGFEIVELEA